MLVMLMFFFFLFIFVVQRTNMSCFNIRIIKATRGSDSIDTVDFSQLIQSLYGKRFEHKPSIKHIYKWNCYWRWKKNYAHMQPHIQRIPSQWYMYIGKRSTNDRRQPRQTISSLRVPIWVRLYASCPCSLLQLIQSHVCAYAITTRTHTQRHLPCRTVEL